MLDLLTVGPKFKRPACRLATAAIDRYLLPAPDLSSKPAAASRYCCCRLTGQTDGQTDTQLFYGAFHILCQCQCRVIFMLHIVIYWHYYVSLCRLFSSIIVD